MLISSRGLELNVRAADAKPQALYLVAVHVHVEVCLSGTEEAEFAFIRGETGDARESCVDSSP
jgi:hypothetical protein